MGRPTAKTDLLTAATANYEKLNTLVSELTEKELSISFDFSGDEKKKEAHWRRDKNLRDIFIHLYGWHQLLLNWVYSNQKSDSKPFIPEPYNWKAYGDMSVEFWKRHQSTSLEDAKATFQQSHNEVMKLTETFSNEELFSKGVYKWVGRSTLGSYFVNATASRHDWAMKKLRAHRKNCAKIQEGHIMHFVKAKGILSAKNGINLYRGCSHRCIYCDSRSKCYHMEHAFRDIEVEENAVDLLEYTLTHKRRKCMVGTSPTTDPYIPLGLEVGNVREALNLIYEHDFGFAVITKSSHVLRDLDLLQKIGEKTKCVVQMTLTTHNEDLRKKIEPNVSTTGEYFKVLRKLRDAGIPTVVWLTPILPFINDTEDNISGILNMCIEARVYGVICFGMGLMLREGNREYFYEQLDRLFPNLKKEYIHTYGNQYMIESSNNKNLMRLFHRRCEENGIMHDNEQIFNYLHFFEEKNDSRQLSIWDWEVRQMGMLLIKQNGYTVLFAAIKLLTKLIKYPSTGHTKTFAQNPRQKKIQDWRIKKIEQRKIKKECTEHSCYRPAERRRKPKIIAVRRHLRSVRSGICAAVMQRQCPTARAIGGVLAVAKYVL